MSMETHQPSQLKTLVFQRIKGKKEVFQNLYRKNIVEWKVGEEPPPSGSELANTPNNFDIMQNLSTKAFEAIEKENKRLNEDTPFGYHWAFRLFPAGCNSKGVPDSNNFRITFELALKPMDRDTWHEQRERLEQQASWGNSQQESWHQAGLVYGGQQVLLPRTPKVGATQDGSQTHAGANQWMRQPPQENQPFRGQQHAYGRYQPQMISTSSQPGSAQVQQPAFGQPQQTFGKPRERG